MKALLSLAGRLLWPSLPTKVLWLVLVAATLLSLFSQQAKLVIVPLTCLLLLIFCIPLQFMSLRHKQSWLLLPVFKSQSRLLLVMTAMLSGLLSGCFMLLADKGFWPAFNLGLLAFAGLILPCLVYGNLRPLLLNSAVLLALLSSKVLHSIPLPEHIPFSWLLAAGNILLLGWFWHNWLRPVPGRPLSAASHQPRVGPWPWLRRLTRKPATLSGSLLLGQGDSWQARAWRTVGYCWYVPGFFLLWSLFSSSGYPQTPAVQAIIVLIPIILLINSMENMLRRVRRAWLALAVNRRQLFTLLEKQAFTELLPCAFAMLPIIIWLLPAHNVAAMLLFWPALALCSLYLNWRLINAGTFWSGTALAVLNVTATGLVALCWRLPPYYLLLAAILLLGAALLLRQQVKSRLLTQDWAKLKLLAAQQLKVGL